MWIKTDTGCKIKAIIDTLKYALRSRSGNKEYEEFIPAGEGAEKDFCKIGKMTKQSAKGEEKELGGLTWGDIVIPPDRTLYIYVTLDFPNDTQVWNRFVDADDTSLYNTFCFRRDSKVVFKSSIEHRIARSTQVYLKTGMYGTDSDSCGYIYPNSDETERTVKYYLVIYNELPTTGGSGTAIFYLAGIILILASLAFLVIRRYKHKRRK